MKSSLKNMFFVLVIIALVTGLAVGYVYKVTKAPIEKAKDDKISASLQEVLPPNERIIDPTDVMAYDSDKMPVKVYRAVSGDSPAGYAVETYSNNGYSGTIKLLVGFDPELKIHKIVVTEQNETPGLGANIEDSESHFVVQFEGQDPASYRLAVKVDGGDVDAISSSTITSRAYTDAVKRAYDAVKKLTE